MISIMQPYFFPYLGYYQLVAASDLMVFYDDVNFMKGGWIHRNRIYSNQKEQLFTVPLQKQSSFVPINETEIHAQQYALWKKKFLKSLTQSYGKAPHFSTTIDLVTRVLDAESTSLAKLTVLSITEVANFLGLKTAFQLSSESYPHTNGLERRERLITISQEAGYNQYLNPPGGKQLYQKEDFRRSGIDLHFLQPRLKPYPQFAKEFIPGLSMIDVMMFNSSEEIRRNLLGYDLD